MKEEEKQQIDPVQSDPSTEPASNDTASTTEGTAGPAESDTSMHPPAEDTVSETPTPVAMDTSAPAASTGAEERVSEPMTSSQDTAETDVPASEPTATQSGKTSPVQIILSVLVVVVFLCGLVYLLEQRGVMNTGLFDGMAESRLQETVVARVGDRTISEYDLQVSIEQQQAAAAAQGLDVNDPEVDTAVREQALTLLVNTALLKNEAVAQGFTVDDAAVMERYDTLVAEVGGEEVLLERMNEFGVSQDMLERDIRDELLIQQLIDQVFAENEITVSDEEATQLYEEAGGEAAGLPPFGEVEQQIIAQITSTKEQELINDYVADLREAADVEILI